MKNVNKIISAVVLVVLLAATVVGVVLGICGRNTQYVTVTENGEEVRRALYRQVAYIPNTINDNWQEAIRPEAKLAGGYSYTLTAEQGDMSDADFAKALKKAAKVIKARAELVVGTADVKVENNAVVLTVAENAYNSLIATLVSPVGEFNFAFYNEADSSFGEPVMDASAIKQAYYYTGENGVYQIQLQLTKKGAKAYNELLSAHAGEYVYLMMDGSYVAAVRLAALQNNVLSIATQDWSTAFIVADCLRSGALPMAMTVSEEGAAAASMEGFLDGAIIGVAVALLLVCLYLLAVARFGGVVGAWTVCAQVVLFCLAVAVTAVSANWTLTLGALIVLIVCEALFVFGLVSLLGAMAGSIRAGMGAHAALRASFKKNTRMLLAVYGVTLAVGLVLMFAFQGALYGVLGRMIALSAIISAAMLFVFLRVALSCCFRAVGSRSSLYGAAK